LLPSCPVGGNQVRYAMNSENNIATRSELRSFSDRPVLHYFLAIGITSIAAEFFFAFRTYECLYSGNDWSCTYDPDSPAMTGRDSYIPNVPSILLSTALISVYIGLFRILFSIVICAPVYALAYYVGLRCAVHRNVAGIAFWIGAWSLAFLSFFSLLVGIGAFKNYLAIMHGLFCGIVYCALAFLHRDKTVEG
jgi:hypothetical protein